MDSTTVITNHMRTFRIFGMLPTMSSSYLYKLWGLITSFAAGIGLVTCQSLSILHVESTNDLINELLLLCTTSTVGIKIALFNSHRQHLLNILDIMKTADERIESVEDIGIMKNVSTSCRRINLIFLTCYIGSLPPLFLQLIFLDKTERTWKSTALVPNDFAQLSEVYYSVLAFQAIGNCFNCILALALDTFNFLLITILCGHIEVLSLHLKKIGKPNKRSASQKNRLKLLDYLNHYTLLTEYFVPLEKNISVN